MAKVVGGFNERNVLKCSDLLAYIIDKKTQMIVQNASSIYVGGYVSGSPPRHVSIYLDPDRTGANHRPSVLHRL
jgi:hypothetical protein